ncbi:MAG: MlaD family protein [Myxococcota bacterium]
MIEARRNYIVVGGFVVAMLTAGIAWVAVLSGGTGANDEYWIRYDNVMGLSSGAQILFEGYPVGRIEAIAPIPKAEGGGFRLDVSVQSGWPIPVDSRAESTSAGPLSAVVVNIVRGESAQVLAPGSEIASDESPGLMQALSSVAGQVGALTAQIEPVLASLGDTVPIILDDVRGLTERLSGAADRLSAMLSPENAEHVSRILAELDNTATNTARLSGELVATRAEVDGLLASMQGMVDENRPDVRQAVSDMQTSLAVLADHMSAVTRNLEATMRNMNEFSAQIRRDPSRLILPSRRADGEDQ